MIHSSRLFPLMLVLSSFIALQTQTSAGELQVLPAELNLTGNFEQIQLVVVEPGSQNSLTRAKDLTTEAVLKSGDEAIVRVLPGARLLAVGNGKTQLRVTVGKSVREVPVEVSGVVAEPVIGWDRFVQPILSKAGCNMGACHAAQYGQGGLKLSVFGFDPRSDHREITREDQQRRVNFLNPEESLFLMKPTMQIPHGGSRRLEKESLDYQILAAWLKSGASAPVKTPPKITKMVVLPNRRVGDLGFTQQLRVEATYNDGTVRDVTAWAKFDAMDDGVAKVTEEGLVTTVGIGQAPVMVRFEGQAEISMFVVPNGKEVKLTGWKNQNFVDELASAKFQELGIEPVGRCDDATFLRRAFLDCIGTIPSVEVTRDFLASKDPQKREKLIDQLLGLSKIPSENIYNDQYAALWTLKWSDLIRNSSKVLGDQGMWAMHNWLKESFRTNRPFNEVVQELVTAKGSIYNSGPANYFRINRSSADLAESTAQLFLGVRLACAKCHHHPFEKYSEGDYYGFSAFFSRVTTKNSEEFGLFGRESVVMVRGTGDVRHPRTGELLKPTPLDGEPVDHELDRRIPLAEWLTSPENKFFSQSIVNRYVGYLLGRGLVEPIDDLRATNPASNGDLMEALSEHFVKSNFDLKQLIKAIMLSRVYQLESQPTKENAADRKFYSYFKVKRIAAEPLLDAVDRVTEVPTKFKDLPQGTRAIDLPDAEYPNYFLTTFDKPKRASVCECERSPHESLTQALHMLNGDIMQTKITNRSGRIARLLKEKKSHEEIIDELFLATLSRFPNAREQEFLNEYRKEFSSLEECYQDILWALMNSKEFLFIH